MPTQICPKCRKDSFSWYIDEELSNFTFWSCSNCDFQTYEDDRDEVEYGNCKEITKTFLKNEDEEFWWCSVCNTIFDLKQYNIEE
jgi:ribosomal protein L37AE/L43A